MPALKPRTRKWTRAEYYRMADLGMFRDQRVELIEGTIVQMPPQKNFHVIGIGLVEQRPRAAFGPRYWVRIQAPLHLGPRSAPEPDVAVVPGGSRDYTRTGHPTTALLIVEVSETTLAYDRGRKASLYARTRSPITGSSTWFIAGWRSAATPSPTRANATAGATRTCCSSARRTASPPSPPRRSASPSPTCCRREASPRSLTPAPPRLSLTFIAPAPTHPMRPCHVLSPNPTITSVLKETRTFPPPPEFAAKAHDQEPGRVRNALAARQGRSRRAFGREQAESLDLDQALGQGARLERAARPVVRRRQAQRQRQLPRPPPRRAAPQQGRHHLGRRAGRQPRPDVPDAPPRGLQVRQRPQGPGHQGRRPRHHLHADGPGGGDRHAGLRPHRRRPQRRLRRLQRRRRRRPQQRRQGQTARHRRRRLAARQGRAAQAERR